MSSDRHPDHIIYACWVLWLIGFTEIEISGRLGLRKKQVSGLINQSPYSGRAMMTDEQRQAHYVTLKSKRYRQDGEPRDRGMIAFFPETVRPLRGKQKKVA
jgi:hypothetical protein